MYPITQLNNDPMWNIDFYFCNVHVFPKGKHVKLKEIIVFAHFGI